MKAIKSSSVWAAEGFLLSKADELRAYFFVIAVI